MTDSTKPEGSLPSGGRRFPSIMPWKPPMTKCPTPSVLTARRPEILTETMRWVPEAGLAKVKRVYIFDDLLTTGGHFIAAKKLLRRGCLEIEVRGLVLAMRRFSPPPERLV